jgi:hypothetical protein
MNGMYIRRIEKRQGREVKESKKDREGRNQKKGVVEEQN